VGDGTLAKKGLLSIVRAARLSRATMENIRQNLYFSLRLHNRFRSPVAAMAMSFSPVPMIANAMRLEHAEL
jgi:cation transport ATPase